MNTTDEMDGIDCRSSLLPLQMLLFAGTRFPFHAFLSPWEGERNCEGATWFDSDSAAQFFHSHNHDPPVGL